MLCFRVCTSQTEQIPGLPKQFSGSKYKNQISFHELCAWTVILPQVGNTITAGKVPDFRDKTNRTTFPPTVCFQPNFSLTIFEFPDLYRFPAFPEKVANLALSQTKANAIQRNVLLLFFFVFPMISFIFIHQPSGATMLCFYKLVCLKLK